MATKLLGSLSKGLLFVISAPAGTGKTTLVRMLMKEFACITESVSCTTRPPRPNEIPEKDYHFLTKNEFQKKIDAGDFLEFAEVFGNYYGTSRAYVEAQEQAGKHVCLVIDTQGAMQLKGKIPAVFIFISPPTLEELRVRLVNRKTESIEAIEERIAWAKKEMEAAPHYDYNIINDNLDIAYQILRSIVIAEEHRVNNRVSNKEKQ